MRSTIVIIEPAKLATFLIKLTIYLTINDVGLGQCCLHQPIDLITQLIPKEIQDPGTQYKQTKMGSKNREILPTSSLDGS